MCRSCGGGSSCGKSCPPPSCGSCCVNLACKTPKCCPLPLQPDPCIRPSRSCFSPCPTCPIPACCQRLCMVVAPPYFPPKCFAPGACCSPCGPLLDPCCALPAPVPCRANRSCGPCSVVRQVSGCRPPCFSPCGCPPPCCPSPCCPPPCCGIKCPIAVCPMPKPTCPKIQCPPPTSCCSVSMKPCPPPCCGGGCC